MEIKALIGGQTSDGNPVQFAARFTR